MLSRFNLSLGSWLSVPVTLHWSLLLFFIIVGIWKPENLIALLLLFFIVLLHELGHCFAGQKYGMEAESILLCPLGGVARIQVPNDPIQEIVIALAGPAVNFIAAIPLLFLSLWHSVFFYVFVMNAVMLVFNLIPAFPMDGGRVLRGCLHLGLQDRYQATLWAVRTAYFFCGLFVLLSILTLNPFMLGIAIFVFGAACGELENVKKHSGFLCRHNSIIPRTPIDTHNSESLDYESERLISMINREVGKIGK